MRELERAKDELKESIEFEAEKDEADSKKTAEKDTSEKDKNDDPEPPDLGNLPSSRI